MALLKFKDSNGVWKVLYGALLKKVLRKDNNLSDVEDPKQSRINLGFIGDMSDPNRFAENETHNHDSRYLKLSDVSTEINNRLTAYVKKAGDTMTGALNFAANAALNLANDTWNKVGDDVQIGDKNVAGKLCIQGQNGDTGIALFQKNNDSNKGTINYDGTTFKFDKPVNVTGAANITGTVTVNNGANIAGNTAISGSASVTQNLEVTGTIKTTGGFLCENVPVDDLNNYHQKINFIYGAHTNGKNDELGKLIGTSGWDYAGIVFGNALNTAADSNAGEIGQLISQGSKGLYFRSRDSYAGGSWTKWQQLAFMDDLNTIDGVSAKQYGVNGYIKFSNGIVIQWGKFTSKQNDTTTTVKFPISFKSACYSCVCSGNCLEGTNVQFRSATLSKATFYTGYINTVCWIAIGK